MIGFIFFLLGQDAFASMDFSTPEATVKSYQFAYSQGNQEAVSNSFNPPSKDFYIARISNCQVKKAQKHSAAEIRKQNDAGIVPPLKVGDMEVIQTCTVDGKRIQEFHYDLRKFGKEWKIISHSATGAP